MSSYSRIFHHITAKDVKRNHLENIEVQKIKEYNLRKKEIYLQEQQELLEGQKSNWRNELTDA